MARKRRLLPFPRHALDVLLYHPLPERRIVRSLLLGYAASSVGLGALVASTYWRIGVYVTAGIAGTLGGLIGVGEPNDAGDHSVAIPLTLTKEAAPAREPEPPKLP